MIRSRLSVVLGWGGLALCLIGVFLVVTPGNFAGLDGDPPDGTIGLTEEKQRIVLPPDETYGIWVEDKDNSGYSIGCSIVDEGGRPIALEEPSGWTAGTETGWFDYEFSTGDGKLTVLDCTSSEAEFSVRPLGRSSSPFSDFRWVMLSLTIGGTFVQAGIAMLVAWALVLLLGKPKKASA